MDHQFDLLLINATLATCTQLGLMQNAAIGLVGNKITWLGNMHEITTNDKTTAKQIIDAKHQLITPGFIDCHTHLVYAGNRAQEFAARLQGRSYADIAKAGGGILATVKATREASLEELIAESMPRARALMQNGVTTLEIKSGYGLNLATEIKMLQAARAISERLPLSIKTTFLGAHTVPPEYKKNPDRYVDYVCNEMLPTIAEQRLADAVDVFCEHIAFNLVQTERIFDTAQRLKLNIKCHAEQLSNTDVSILAANYRALSVDHLEHISTSGLQAIQKSRTVAVLLPGAYYFLREKKVPPIQQFRDFNIPMALASDCNPGTSPITSLLTILNMGSVLFGMTVLETLHAVTIHAAQALGVEAKIGTLAVGKIADLAIWGVQSVDELSYYLGTNPLQLLIKNGQRIPFLNE